MEKIIEKIKELAKNPLYAAIAGFVVGLIIGLPLLGWYVFPVVWTDASPKELRQDVKTDYLSMTIESFAKNQDQTSALQRWNELGTDASKVMDAVIAEAKLSPKDIAAFSNLVKASGGESKLPVATAEAAQASQPAADKPTAAAAVAATPVAGAATQDTSTTTSFPLIPLLVVSCIVMLVLAGALIYLFIIRKRNGSGLLSPDVVDEETEPTAATATAVEKIATSGEAPITQFMATYNLGDDLYDDSFAIDSPTGVFLGECGVGISETIGVGDPKKVTAFEIWLFDKNDIQTVTKVFMSDNAFNDVEISQRLAAKGEPVLVERGKTVLLDTATLQLEARVVDMNYAQGALPANSYFERMILELSIYPKPGA